MVKVEHLRIEVLEQERGGFQSALCSALAWSLIDGSVIYIWRSKVGYQIARYCTGSPNLIQSAKVGRHYVLTDAEACGSASIAAQVYYLIDPVFDTTRNPQ